MKCILQIFFVNLYKPPRNVLKTFVKTLFHLVLTNFSPLPTHLLPAKVSPNWIQLKLNGMWLEWPASSTFKLIHTVNDNSWCQSSVFKVGRYHPPHRLPTTLLHSLPIDEAHTKNKIATKNEPKTLWNFVVATVSEKCLRSLPFPSFRSRPIKSPTALARPTPNCCGQWTHVNPAIYNAKPSCI